MGGGSTGMSGIMGVLVVAVIDMRIVDLHWARAKHGLNCWLRSRYNGTEGHIKG